MNVIFNNDPGVSQSDHGGCISAFFISCFVLKVSTELKRKPFELCLSDEAAKIYAAAPADEEKKKGGR